MSVLIIGRVIYLIRRYKLHVRIIGIKDGKISLSMKDAEPEETEEVFDYHENGQATTGLGALLKGLKL